ncbi:MAG TPA: hypothetical protein DEG17_20110 [Cyanobacteria bacterium UBA11149]|nr:hypothetical protein [Cyanobacteria bacterium UBA11366]HBR73624.1 hypothetical protein [Cyanobacteria bacterium UBA11159]HBW91103.1 hypothetical protein [Cyanobacteria bacterium UBA11149]HCA96564.1 hypothetical protein [Cyanobacteria bacterium UBA9226]
MDNSDLAGKIGKSAKIDGVGKLFSAFPPSGILKKLDDGDRQQGTGNSFSDRRALPKFKITVR